MGNKTEQAKRVNFGTIVYSKHTACVQSDLRDFAIVVLVSSWKSYWLHSEAVVQVVIARLEVTRASDVPLFVNTRELEPL